MCITGGSNLVTKVKHIRQADQLLGFLITDGRNTLPTLVKLLEKYCSFSCTHQALSIFEHLHHPNLVFFNTLIRCSRPEISIRLLVQKASDYRLIFDELTYLFGFGACARLRSSSSLRLGRQLHGRIWKHGYLSDLKIGATLIHFYGRTNDVASGRKAFDEMPERNIVTWNAMLSGYCKQGTKNSKSYLEAILLFKELLSGGCQETPNGTSIVCVLSASALLGAIEVGASLHGCIEKIIDLPENDVYIGTALVEMYSKCGLLTDAFSIFERMAVKNVLTWSSMATGFALHGKGEAAVGFLDSMVQNGIMPNAVTFTCVLSACCHSGLIKEGIHLFNCMKTTFGVSRTIQHYGCVVNLLCKGGHLREAYRTIMEMDGEADAILWRILLSACQFNGDAALGEEVGNILLEMQRNEKGDDASEDYIALSNAFASSGKWQEVERVRESMQMNRIHVKAGASFS